jgi:hypothetical protein
MSLSDAFAGIREAQHSGTQAPKRLSTKVPRGRSAEMPKSQSAEAPREHEPVKILRTQATAKSRHPEYEPVKIYVRSETRKRAWRKWEDAEGGDFSDLMQMLLEKYLGAGKRE